MSELLVEMGLPLVQAKQQFASMDLNLKKEFYQMIERWFNKIVIETITLTFTNFLAPPTNIKWTK